MGGITSPAAYGGGSGGSGSGEIIRPAIEGWGSGASLLSPGKRKQRWRTLHRGLPTLRLQGRECVRAALWSPQAARCRFGNARGGGLAWQQEGWVDGGCLSPPTLQRSGKPSHSHHSRERGEGRTSRGWGRMVERGKGWEGKRQERGRGRRSRASRCTRPGAQGAAAAGRRVGGPTLRLWRSRAMRGCAR